MFDFLNFGPFKVDLPKISNLFSSALDDVEKAVSTLPIVELGEAVESIGSTVSASFPDIEASLNDKLGGLSAIGSNIIEAVEETYHDVSSNLDSYLDDLFNDPGAAIAGALSDIDEFVFEQGADVVEVVEDAIEELDVIAEAVVAEVELRLVDEFSLPDGEIIFSAPDLVYPWMDDPCGICCFFL